MFCLEGNYVPKSCWVYFWSSSFGSSSFVRSRSSTDQLISSFSCSSNLNQLDKKYQFPVMALLADVTNIDWHYSWKQGFPKKLFGNNFEEGFFVIELSDKNWLCPSECDNWEAVGGVSPWASLRPPTTGVGLPDSPITGSTAPVPVIFCKSGMYLKFSICGESHNDQL